MGMKSGDVVIFDRESQYGVSSYLSRFKDYIRPVVVEEMLVSIDFTLFF